MPRGGNFVRLASDGSDNSPQLHSPRSGSPLASPRATFMEDAHGPPMGLGMWRQVSNASQSQRSFHSGPRTGLPSLTKKVSNPLLESSGITVTSLSGMQSFNEEDGLEDCSLEMDPEGVQAWLSATIAESRGWKPTVPTGGTSLAEKRQGLEHYKKTQRSLEDRRLVEDVSKNVLSHLTHMFQHMKSSMEIEKNRHSSDVVLILRKVEADLRATFQNVRETFWSLTEQIAQLSKEVESRRKQVKDIYSLHAKAKDAMEAQAQYVLELEAVLGTQGEGFSDRLKQLSAEAAMANKEAEKTKAYFREREHAYQKQVAYLKAELSKYTEAESYAARGGGPPPLPEMPASWTILSPFKSSEESQDIAGAVMVHCDANRSVPRSRQSQRPKTDRRTPLASIELSLGGSWHPASPRGPRSARRPQRLVSRENSQTSLQSPREPQPEPERPIALAATRKLVQSGRASSPIPRASTEKAAAAETGDLFLSGITGTALQPVFQIEEEEEEG